MDETLLQELSSVIIEKLNLTTFEFLSAFNSLSGTPIHPYDQLKYEHFDTDYQFKTIDDLEIPSDFCIHACTAALTSICQQQHEQHIDHFDRIDDMDNHPHLGNAFAVLSGDEFVVDKEKLKSFIEFHEIVRSIPVESITRENSLELAHKLLSHYNSIA
jgi:hypothetical protein